MLHCSNPLGPPNPTGESEPKPEDTEFISFLLSFYLILVFKSVETRILGPTRMADPNRSPVYSDVFIYLKKKHFINLFDCGSGFSFGQAHNHLQIHVIWKAHKHLTKYIYKEGNHAFSK